MPPPRANVLTHTHARTHTQNLFQCFSLCLATPIREPTPLISESQNPKSKGIFTFPTCFLLVF